MAWRQSPGGSEQHLTLAAAAARTRTQRPGKHLAVHASELVVKPDFQILRRYRRPLLLRLEHTHRPTLEDYVHRATRLGSSRSLNLRIGMRACHLSIARNRTSSVHRDVHGKYTRQPDGPLLLPADLVAQWEQQIATKYADFDDATRNAIASRSANICRSWHLRWRTRIGSLDHDVLLFFGAEI